MEEGTRLARWKWWAKEFDTDRHWGIVDTIREIAAEHDTTCAAVALAWLIAQPQVSSVIFGARHVGHVTSAIPAAELELTPEQLERLDKASAPSLGYPYAFIKQVQGQW